MDVRIGDFDLLLIDVHMKASRGASNRAIRNRQAEAIATFIAAETAGNQKDVLVVGDYNMIPGEDDENFDAMNPTGFLRFASTEDLEGQGSHIDSDGSIGKLLGGFAVSAAHTAEYIEGSLRIFPLHRAMGRTLAEFRSCKFGQRRVGVSDRLARTGHAHMSAVANCRSALRSRSPHAR